MDRSTVDIVIVLVLVAVVFFGFVRERLKPDVVALGAVGILLATGVLGTEDVLGVFANTAASQCEARLDSSLVNETALQPLQLCA